MDARFYGIRPRLVTHPPRAPSPSIGAWCRLVHNVVELIVITCKCTYDRERERHGPNQVEFNRTGTEPTKLRIHRKNERNQWPIASVIIEPNTQ